MSGSFYRSSGFPQRVRADARRAPERGSRPSAPCLGSLRRGRLSSHHRPARGVRSIPRRSEEHTSELQSLMRISYAVFCLKKKTENTQKYYVFDYNTTSNILYSTSI